MTVPEHRRSTGDTIATAVLGALAVLAGAGSVLFSPFFVMATDSCGADNCDMSRITMAYVVTWGGVVLAAVIGVLGIVRAARRHSAMWPWPAIALAMVAGSFAIGAYLATSVTA